MELKDKIQLNKGQAKLVAGSISGAIASVLVQPLDVIKTRQQQGFITGQLAGQAVQKYKSTLETCLMIVKEERLVGLWKGTAPTLYRIIPGAGINFFILHHISNFMNNGSDKALSPMVALTSGAAARTMSTILVLPVSVVKTRFEGFGTNAYKSTFDALKTISKTEGLRGLFSGLVPSVLRDAPFSGLYFLLYTQLQAKLKTTYTPNDVRPGTLINLTAGGIAATIATIVTHPQDLIKTRLQITPLDANKSSLQICREVMTKILKEEGLKGFYKGLMPRLLRRPLSNALTWAIYEDIVTFLTKKREAA